MKGQIVLNQKTAAASQVVLVSLHCWDMKREVVLAAEKNGHLKATYVCHSSYLKCYQLTTVL